MVMTEQTKITALDDGPYLVKGPVVLLDADENEFRTERAPVALCRCGGSQNKPFCDGTHGKIGFSDRNRADPANNRRKAYAGKGITIFDNRALCAHAAFCTDEHAAVFRHKDKPWIVPDAAAVEKVVAVIRKCP